MFLKVHVSTILFLISRVSSLFVFSTTAEAQNYWHIDTWDRAHSQTFPK
jgi:hypothetical protein